jgi:hypothetical protein
MNRKTLGVVLCVLGIATLVFDYMNWNYAWGYLNYPLDTFIALASVAAIIAGVINFSGVELKQQHYSTLKKIGLLILVIFFLPQSKTLFGDRYEWLIDILYSILIIVLVVWLFVKKDHLKK